MRKGKKSNTAQFVAFNRALGTLQPQVPGFSDPVAERFLPEMWLKQVRKTRLALQAGKKHSPYPFWFRGMGIFNQFRTVILDAAIRRALPLEQMIILGAGMDSRAWRMPELSMVRVFEADHFDTQVWKKTCSAPAPVLAREVRYVAVDFAKDDLQSCLVESGFDTKKTSCWLWEGVTMYLTPADIARTLSAVAALSAPGSTLALTYMAKENGRIPHSWFLALLGEPARSAFSTQEMADLAGQVRWKTVSDTGIEDWKRELTPGLVLNRKAVGIQWLERIWVGKL